jgi:hypothetical protein
LKPRLGPVKTLTFAICESVNDREGLARLAGGVRVTARVAFEALARGALFPADFFVDFVPIVAFFAPTFLLDTGFFLDPFLDTDGFDNFPFEAPFFFEPAFFFDPPFFFERLVKIFVFLEEVFLDEVFFPDARFLRAPAAADLRDFPVAAFLLVPNFFLLLAGALFFGMRSAPRRCE